MLLLLLPSMLSDQHSSSFQTELLTMGCTLFYINLKQKLQEATLDLIILSLPTFNQVLCSLPSLTMCSPPNLFSECQLEACYHPGKSLKDPSLEGLNGTRENTYKNCHFRYPQKRQKPITLSEVHLSVNSLHRPMSFQ